MAELVKNGISTILMHETNFRAFDTDVWLNLKFISLYLAKLPVLIHETSS